jgi:hypothetical protein
MRHITLIISVLALAVAAPAIAGKGGVPGGNGSGSGGGSGHVTTGSGACTVDGDVINGTGVPNWTLMNFMVTDSSGTWVIGYTDDGTRSIDVPVRTGQTTYEFTGVTYGKDGAKYDVFATCSA